MYLVVCPDATKRPAIRNVYKYRELEEPECLELESRERDTYRLCLGGDWVKCHVVREHYGWAGDLCVWGNHFQSREE